ncbi:hypothetical protein [Acetobacterium sp.]|uniref:hypothetical protein n=1 Tax=Acetobacterium sp. TaxID=1872094 RepID=UPI002F41C4EF
MSEESKAVEEIPIIIKTNGKAFIINEIFIEYPIIFYNTFLLSKLLEQIDITKKFEIIERIKRVSPIAGPHVNLSGRLNLTGKKEPLEIDLLINQLNDFLS